MHNNAGSGVKNCKIRPANSEMKTKMWRKKIMKNKKQYEPPIAESVFVDGLDILTESDNLTKWD